MEEVFLTNFLTIRHRYELWNYFVGLEIFPCVVLLVRRCEKI